MVALDFLGLVLAKLTHDVVSLRFLLFAMVGSIGLFVHFAALFIALRGLSCAVSRRRRPAARCSAMTSNFILNNFLTYRDQRLKGFAHPARPVAVLPRVQRRPRRQCRRRVLGLRSGADLVAGGRGRRADGRGLELRDVRTVRLAQAMKLPMSLHETRGSPATPSLTMLALVAVRLVAAALTPLTFDEAYYWMWSKHLAGGYYDHPPMVALVIRLGTMIAGDTELGVRLVSILLALPMSWAVYRAAAILFGGHARGGDRDHPAQRHADGGGRHPDRHAGCAAAGGLELRAVFSRQGAGDRTRRVVARGRRRGRRGAAVEIHRAVFRPGDPDLAGRACRNCGAG